MKKKKTWRAEEIPVTCVSLWQRLLCRERSGRKEVLAVGLVAWNRSWKHAYEFPWRNPEAAWQSIEAGQLQPYALFNGPIGKMSLLVETLDSCFGMCKKLEGNCPESRHAVSGPILERFG